VLDTVGTDGAVGTAFIVTVPAAKVIHVLSAMLLTESVYVPGARPEKVALAWYPAPTLYCTPAWKVNTIVPDGTAHVGCVVLETVGTAGAVGIALIVTVAAANVTQVLSVMFLTDSVYVPGASPAKVLLA
jgi:hypothetical protein